MIEGAFGNASFDVRLIDVAAGIAQDFEGEGFLFGWVLGRHVGIPCDRRRCTPPRSNKEGNEKRLWNLQNRINVLTSQFEFGLKVGRNRLEKEETPTPALPRVQGREQIGD